MIRHWYHNVVGVDEAEGDLRTDEKGAALIRSNWFLRPTHQETRDVLPAPILLHDCDAAFKRDTVVTVPALMMFFAFERG